jgi:hypothetical protein
VKRLESWESAEASSVTFGVVDVDQWRTAMLLVRLEDKAFRCARCDMREIKHRNWLLREAHHHEGGNHEEESELHVGVV